jgi:hypothetical protein
LEAAVQKQIDALPRPTQETFHELVLDLKAHGPVQPGWPNYSKLGPDTYHCHLARKWEAVWTHKTGSNTIEVTYVGSREGAPY